MSQAQAELLNLELAWKRVKLDIPDRVFTRNPFEVKLIEYDLASYLDDLNGRICNDTYNPNPANICDAPKGGWLVRPGSILSVEDRIVFYACLGVCMPHIYEALEWSQGVVDFSYEISNEFENIKWLRNQFRSWTKFRTMSIEKIETGISHVITTDISNYYDNVNIKILMSDLKNAGVDDNIVNLLSRCLNKWAQSEGKGIPQGYTPSDLLGKLYLNSVDANFRAMGYDHLRYSDDIRIFCKDEVEAKKALVDLIKLLRARGLNLQSAKTKIHTADEARTIIDGIQPVLQPIMEDLNEALGIDNPYFSTVQVDELLEQMEGDTSVEVLTQAFLDYFIDAREEDFDKTLFHFLLNRLGKSKSDIAVAYCLDLLKTHPEETTHTLKYFQSIDVIDQIENLVVEFLQSEHAVYPYQHYQILEWFSEYAQNPSEDLLEIARRMAFDNSHPKYLRVVSRKLVGEFGTSADLERLESLYSELDDEIEKCDIICCLKKMELSRRNSFLGRAQHDGKLVQIASNLVKSGAI
ncbi:hypothetical protein C6502_08710 [Candidatus Poribacteria bacterium]|nr:MAG: hypothetical protein C6502_08710 [Candidatus Poribacteria bacterium]